MQKRRYPKKTRSWPATAFLALVAALVGACRTGPQASEDWLNREAAKPLNVILITVDTLRADRLGAYGSRLGATPHMDALAADGASFTNAATTVPFTLPAHSSIMTGVYPPYHGVRENVGYVLDDSLPTLAELLASDGWDTGGFVSAFVLDSRWGIGRGFSTYFDDFEAEADGSTNLASVQRDGSETVEEAVRWLDRDRDLPVFLWLHLYDPHDPYTPAEPYRSRFPRRPYDGEVAYADSLVGKLRAELETRGLLDDSLLILTADHGEGLGQHNERFHGFFIYDSTIRVPLIVRPPAFSHAGLMVDEPVSHVDLVPTILEILGRPVPGHVQGRSLLPHLRGEAVEEDRVVYSESMYPLLHYGWAALRGIRSKDFKLIQAPRPELYDLAADPLEEDNVLFEQRPASRRLLNRLETLTNEIENRDRPVNQTADLDEETLRQLQALGYVAGSGGVSVDDEGAVDRADPKDRIELHQMVMMAQSHLGKDEREQARELLERAIATDDSMVDAHQMLGTIALQQDRPEPAIEHFRSALAVKDDHALSLFGLAGAYRKLGRREEALAGYQRLLGLQPSDTKSVLAAAQVLDQLGRRREAIATLETGLEREKPAPILFNQLGELISLEGDAARAAGLFQKALDARPELVLARFNLAVLREEEGRFGEATGLYERVIEEAPKHFQAQFNLGRLYGRRGDVTGQRRMWAEALESNPDFVRGYYLLAKLLMDTFGDLGEAERLARRGLERDADHRVGPLGYYVLADILNRTGRPAEATQAVEAGRRLAG